MSARTWNEDLGATGYTVVADPERQLLRMRIWGLWDDSLAQRYERAVLTALGMIPQNTTWDCIVDITNFPPQKPSVQAYHANCMRQSTNIRRAANLVSSSLSQMQIRRLSEESGLPAYSFFTSEAAALKWLETTEAGSSRDGARSAR